MLVDNRDSTGNSVWAIFGDLDGGMAGLMNLVVGLNAVYRMTQCARRTCPDGLYDFVRLPPLRG